MTNRYHLNRVCKCSKARLYSPHLVADVRVASLTAIGNMPKFAFVTVGTSDGEDQTTMIDIDKIRCMYVYKSSQRTMIEFDKDHILRGVKESPEQILELIAKAS